MMREIKFRLWTSEAMFYIDDFYWFEETEIHNVHDIPKHCILMQFTGQRDKNSKEIYEGDIVRVVNMLTTAPGTEPYNAVIEWDKYRWSMRRLGEIFTMTHLESFPLNNLDPFGLDLEIIGNIYENPELIQS